MAATTEISVALMSDFEDGVSELMVSSSLVDLRNQVTGHLVAEQHETGRHN